MGQRLLFLLFYFFTCASKKVKKVFVQFTDAVTIEA
jgi:hypothetical protein